MLTAVNGQAVSKGSTLQELYEGSPWDGSDMTLILRGADGAQRDVVLASRPQSLWNLEAQQALDRNLTFGFGHVGLWFVVINWLAWRRDGHPGILALIGIGAGLAYWAFATGNQFKVGALSQVRLLAGIVLVPAWQAWAGIVLRKLGSAAAEA